MVTFNQVPSNLLEPFVAVEFDSSQAQSALTALQPYRGLIVGQRTTAGSVAVVPTTSITAPTLVTSAAQAQQFFGTGSVAARMAGAWLASNGSTELWVVGVNDAGGATAAAWTLTVTLGGTAEAGTLWLYILGELVQVGVTTGQTDAQIAAAIDAAVTAATNLPVTSSVATNVVTLTARNAGTCGNTVDVRFNYRAGESFPVNVSVAVAQTATGATDPSVLTDLWAQLGDTWYNALAFGWQNAATLSGVDVELEDRFGPMRAIDGWAFFGYRGTHANAITLGQGLNSKQLVVVPREAPASADYEYAAAAAGVTALSLQQNPARPLQTLALTGLAGPDANDEWTYDERNLALQNGLSTIGGDNGVEQIGRIVTTYQRDVTGALDTAYRDLTTRATLSRLRWSLTNRLQSRFPRSLLADDGTDFAPGVPVVTPTIARGEVLGWFREQERAGIVEGFDAFKAALVVERSTSDPSRLEFLVPPNLVNGLIVQAAQIQFVL